VFEKDRTTWPQFGSHPRFKSEHKWKGPIQSFNEKKNLHLKNS